MMQSGGTSPTLDDPPIAEFSGATLLLSGSKNNLNKPTKIASPNDELFIDLVQLADKNHTEIADDLKLPESTRKRRNTSPDSSESLFSASPLADGMARGYFSSRDSLLQRAIHDCKRLLIQEDNGPLLGSWLLTVVDHWDNEKERLVLLCGRSLFIIKYDFIALLLLDHMRLPLNKVTHLLIGRLEYPPHSITPKFQQAANRFTTLVRDCLHQLGQEAGRGGGLLNINTLCRNETTASTRDSHSSNGGVREREGVRISWRASTEPKLTHLWNPWSKQIPWLTFVSHPLLSYKDQHDPQFDVQDFISNIRDALQSATPTESPSSSQPETCLVEYKSILMDSYVGLPALVHNYGQLGFYKVRGKISF